MNSVNIRTLSGNRIVLQNNTYSSTNAQSTVLMRIGTVLFLLKIVKICVRYSTVAQPLTK